MGLQEYDCIIENGKVHPVKLYTKEEVATTDNFVSPATKNNFPKLYVIVKDRDFYFVDNTKQPIASRLRYILKSDKVWSKLTDFKLFIYTIGSFDSDTDDLEKAMEAFEFIKVELVYNIRKKTDKWPLHQTEIHFHNPQNDQDHKYRTLAENIFYELIKKY